MSNSGGLSSLTRRALFVTGTRADFGKLKPLIKETESTPGLRASVFVTGMHMLSRYGCTMREVLKNKFKDVHTFINQMEGDRMELILANTILGLSRYVHEQTPDIDIQVLSEPQIWELPTQKLFWSPDLGTNGSKTEAPTTDRLS